MKKLLVACAFALVLGLGTSSKAQAQIVYGYTIPTYGGVETTGTITTPYGAQTFTNYYSPFTGVIGQTTGSYGTPWASKTFNNFYSPFTGAVGQSYTTNVFGAANSTMYGYNPFTGYRYGTGFYQPNAYVAPLAGVNYGWLRRR